MMATGATFKVLECGLMRPLSPVSYTHLDVYKRQVEGTDCAVTMKETKDGAWKVSMRTGARVNATLACSKLGGGGHLSLIHI